MQEITQKPILFWWTAVQVRNSQLEHCRQLRLFFYYTAEIGQFLSPAKTIAGGPRRVFECPLPECSFIAMSTMALKVLLQILLHGSTFSTLMCHIIAYEDIRCEHYSMVFNHFYLFGSFFFKTDHRYTLMLSTRRGGKKTLLAKFDSWDKFRILTSHIVVIAICSS